MGLATTIRHGARPTVDPGARPTHTFAAAEIARILAAGSRNYWIRWSEISAAKLKRGIVDHSLHLELRNGKRAKFLWLKVDGGWDLLVTELSRSLAGRFEVVNKPIG